ncbi:hypothetical protein S7335_1252 [Synechococcus sp. PCC 7335]|uniref:hypothetical protein n=1 Tax=Synechococcus sp. (strain ATCC 29403 / PCC 7335) TaxID=91464 RepID=UPI00017EB927|nr:hypothetical protein [Synechococcus sp. PCC 7335]EDX82548.1 hypothetical protein S7335_1252 [Synechococcus sp. PCC 7335]
MATTTINREELSGITRYYPEAKNVLGQLGDRVSVEFIEWGRLSISMPDGSKKLCDPRFDGELDKEQSSDNYERLVRVCRFEELIEDVIERDFKLLSRPVHEIASATNLIDNYSIGELLSTSDYVRFTNEGAHDGDIFVDEDGDLFIGLNTINNFEELSCDPGLARFKVVADCDDSVSYFFEDELDAELYAKWANADLVDEDYTLESALNVKNFVVPAHYIFSRDYRSPTGGKWHEP